LPEPIVVGVAASREIAAERGGWTLPVEMKGLLWDEHALDGEI
jgi:hypothetical protein